MSAVDLDLWQIDKRDFLMSTTILSILLIFGVPLVYLTTNISLLIVTPLVLIASILMLTNKFGLFTSLGSSIIVLSSFAANVPLYEIHIRWKVVSLDAMLVDVALFPFLLLLIFISANSDFNYSFSSLLTRTQKIIIGSLGGFIIWMLLAATVGNGRSQPAAFIFVASMVRNLLLLLAGAVIVRYIGITTSLHSLIIVVCSQMAFAFVQMIYGEGFGLTYLGESVKPSYGFLDLGITSINVGQFAGGFTGSSRILTAAVLLLVPVLLLIFVTRERWVRLASLTSLLLGVLVIRVSGTDAGFGALSLILFVSALIYLIDGYIRESGTSLSAVKGSFIGIGISLFLELVNLLLFRFRSISEDKGSESTQVGSSYNPDSEGGTIKRSFQFEDSIISALDAIPVISTNNTTVRIRQYIGAIDLGFQHPIFGIGGYNFYWYTSTYGITEPLAIHNIYLMALASGGIPGALLYLCCLASIFYLCIKQFMMSDQDRLLWGSVLCGLIGFYAFSFWTAIHASGSVALMIFWLFSGFILGAPFNRELKTTYN